MMPIVGAVLTLSDERDVRAQALMALRAHPLIELGELRGAQLPIVVETANLEEDVAFWRELAQTPGVLRHVVAWAGLDAPARLDAEV